MALPPASVTRAPAPLASVPDCGPHPDVSFVTVTYGTGPIVVDMIASLARSLVDTDIRYEVIVVDNPHPEHPDRSRREVELSTSGVRVVSPDQNLGFGGGCEIGAWAARGHTLAFVNPDIEFVPGWIDPLLAALDHPDTSIVAPVLIEPDGSVQEAGQVVLATGGTTPLLDRPSSDESRVVDYSSAACWLVRRHEHERVGGFDPAYHPAYFEDVDYAMRARSLGGRCEVIGASEVIHRRGSSTPGNRLPDVTRQRDEFVNRWSDLEFTQPTTSG